MFQFLKCFFKGSKKFDPYVNTKYRTVGSEYGNFRLLQYWNGRRWKYVHDAQLTLLDTRNDHFDWNTYVSTRNHSNLQSFIEKYPNLSDWYKEVDSILKQAAVRRINREKEREESKRRIDYLN